MAGKLSLLLRRDVPHQKRPVPARQKAIEPDAVTLVSVSPWAIVARGKAMTV